MAEGENSVAKPLQERARIAQILIGVVIVAAIASLWADLGQYTSIRDLIEGKRIPLEELQRVDDRVGVTATIYTVALVLSTITFLLWYSRAYRNLTALGVPFLRYGPRWAVASWFIPILGLFRPKQVMNDVWRGSNPELGEAAVRRPGAGEVSPLVHWWWAMWLLSNWVGTLAVRYTFRSGDPTPEDLRSEAAGYVLADIADVVVGVLAILVIRAVTERQEKRRSQVAGRADRQSVSPAISPASAE